MNWGSKSQAKRTRAEMMQDLQDAVIATGGVKLRTPSGESRADRPPTPSPSGSVSAAPSRSVEARLRDIDEQAQRVREERAQRRMTREDKAQSVRPRTPRDPVVYQDWPEERVARMVELHLAGRSFAVIAEELGATNGAVAGRLNRMGYRR